MSLAALLALLLGFALTAYALLAGADFGAGILDLLARRRAEERAAIERTIGPLWEANHVWLIFAITILFSAFPAAFSVLGTALLAPLAAALLAIVLRGAAFGLRMGQDAQTAPHLRLSQLFGAASFVAPFAFGLVAGGVAQASSSASRSSGVPSIPPSIPWTGPFALVVGLLAACLCTQLAASFMAIRLAGAGRPDLAERFRQRSLRAGAGTLLLSVAALLVADLGAHRLFTRLTGAALPLVILALASLVLSVVAVARRRYGAGRAVGLLAAAALLWGWFVAQSPHLVGPLLTFHTAAATAPALTAVAIACGLVLLAVVPALLLLFSMFAHPAQR